MDFLGALSCDLLWITSMLQMAHAFNAIMTIQCGLGTQWVKKHLNEISSLFETFIFFKTTITIAIIIINTIK